MLLLDVFVHLLDQVSTLAVHVKGSEVVIFIRYLPSGIAGPGGLLPHTAHLKLHWWSQCHSQQL